MTKKFVLIPACCLLALSGAFAQNASSSSDLMNFGSGGGSPSQDSGDAAASPSPAEKDNRAKPAASPSGPTIITATGDVTYDEKTRMAIFTGEYYGVFVKDPQFTVNCDKLTAFLRRNAGAGATPAKDSRAPKPSSSPDAKAADQKASGLQRAIAEGTADRPVVIVQQKVNSDGKTENDIGIGLRADYNADTGDIVLTGWPRVSQGINTQIATSARTTMTMNRNNNTMLTTGPSQTVITEENNDSKKSDSGASPSATPNQ